MNNLPPALIAALAAWLATTAIILILAAWQRRRLERDAKAFEALRTRALELCRRHDLASGPMAGARDWQAFDREMDIFKQALSAQNPEASS